MKDELEILIVSLIEKSNLKNSDDFISLLEQDKELIDKIIQASSNNYNVFFSKQTYDGWYCIKDSNKPDNYIVYYQEKGRIDWGVENVKNSAKAVTTLILEAGYLNF